MLRTSLQSAEVVRQLEAEVTSMRGEWERQVQERKEEMDRLLAQLETSNKVREHS